MLIQANAKVVMTNFENIVGNSLAIKRLQLLCDTNTLPHLLLFSGIKGIGKRLIAQALANMWLKVSNNSATSSSFVSDLHVFSPEGKSGMHSIQAIRRLIEEVNLAPFSSGKKVIIIDDAERMLPTSANALLKTLEEPPKNTLIILVTSAPERLLATIVSRSQTVRFCPLTEAEVCKILVDKQNVSVDVAQKLAQGSHGSVAEALHQMNEKAESLQQSIFEHLSKKRGFHEIAQVAKDFQKRLDAKRKAEEAELRSQFASTLKESSPASRQLIEQEIEGALSISILQEVNEVFFIVQAFFLDLERLTANLPLHFESLRPILVQAQVHNRTMPFEKITKGIQHAKQAIDRSSPIQHALEGLLLQLN